MRYLNFVVLSSMVVPLSYAIGPIPPESGFSGFINIGAGVTTVESNTLAESGTNSVTKPSPVSTNHRIVKLPVYLY